MGEEPKRVFDVGALGVDNVLCQEFLPRQEIEKKLHFQFQPINILVTFHPVTLESGQAGNQISQLLQALESFPEIGMVFTMPGADKESENIFVKIKKFVKKIRILFFHGPWAANFIFP